MNEAVVIGAATIETKPLILAIMDFHFMGGSMGSAVGEKITRAIELAIERHVPVLIVSTSGGARMQEGLFSLMQLAKTSAALAKLGEANLPYISLLLTPLLVVSQLVLRCSATLLWPSRELSCALRAPA